MKRIFRKSLAAPLAICAAATVLSASALADDAIKMGYINKMGEHPWFVSEVGGAKSQASQLGVNLMTQDVQFNADLTLTTFDTMVGDGVKGIAIVVPDRALGPVVAEKAAKAGIKLIAVDDDIYTADKKMVPYIGMNAEEIGKQVGTEEARLYKAMGWDKFDDVRIGSIEDQKADTCMRRNKGAEEAFFAAVPSFDKKNIINIPMTIRWKARSRTSPRR
jgi:L-arabinose transport system substrate-binding protein